MPHNSQHDETIDDSFVSDLVGLPTRKKRQAKKRTNVDPTSFGAPESVGEFQTKESIASSQEGMKTGDLVGINPKKKKTTTGLSTTSGIPTETEPISKERGGFAVVGRGRKKDTAPGTNFGLPTNRLPTIDELGGALGGISRYLNRLTKNNRARGLSPGQAITKTRDRGDVANRKTTLQTLTKLQENAILSGNEEEVTKRAAQIDAILQGESAGAFDTEEDIDSILGS